MSSRRTAHWYNNIFHTCADHIVRAQAQNEHLRRAASFAGLNAAAR